MNVVPSVIRTGVPLLVGAAVSFAAAKGIHVSPDTEAQLVVLLGAAAGGVYHWLVRLLEERWPRCGWLLGMAKTPDYQGSDASDYISTTKYDDTGRITEIVTVYRPDPHNDEEEDDDGDVDVR